MENQPTKHETTRPIELTADEEYVSWYIVKTVLATMHFDSERQLFFSEPIIALNPKEHAAAGSLVEKLT